MATLYLKVQGSVLRKRGDTILVTEKKKNILEYPASKVDKIVIMGNIQVTSFAVSYFMREGKEVFFLSRSGKFRGMLCPGDGGGAEIRMMQFEKARNKAFTLNIVRNIVAGKLRNAVSVCKALSGDGRQLHSDDLNKITELAKKVFSSGNIDSIRGIEGAGTRLYYKVLSEFLKPPFSFNGRNRRPPRDPVNVLLSLGYTLLENSIFSSAKINLLDPYIGFFHSDKKGAPALVLDLMEEWRPLVDYWIINAIRKKVFIREQFSEKNGKVHFSDEGVKNYFLMFEKELEQETVHEIFGERTNFFRCMILQSKILVEHFKGKRKHYIPFSLKFR